MLSAPAARARRVPERKRASTRIGMSGANMGNHVGRLSVVAAGVSFVLLNAAPAASRQDDVRILLRRAGQYVLDYHQRLAAVVAEELYVQRLTEPGDAERTLRSEFAIVQGDRDDGWLAIRDVLEVDGEPVGERSRIDALLRAPRTQLRAAASAIAAEQAKYNLGDVYRTINVPTLPLLFLLPDNQSRFRFRPLRAPAGPVAGAEGVSYEERDRPTIIRTPNGRNVVSRGTMWIDPAGRVLRTELVTTEPRGLRAVITVTYEEDARLRLLVPVSMRESYVTADAEIAATATYSNFRRFETESRIIRRCRARGQRDLPLRRAGATERTRRQAGAQGQPAARRALTRHPHISESHANPTVDRASVERCPRVHRPPAISGARRPQQWIPLRLPHASEVLAVHEQANRTEALPQDHVQRFQDRGSARGYRPREGGSDGGGRHAQDRLLRCCVRLSG